MHHLAAEDLAALAVDGDSGQPSQGPLRRHLLLCPACSSELAALRRVVEAARSSTADDRLRPPPERVWTAITAQLAADEDPPAGPGHGVPVTPDAPVLPDAPHHSPAPAPSRRRLPALPAGLAAVVCLLAGAGAGASVVRWQQPDQAIAAPREGEVFRLTAPGPVPGADARRVTGTVRLEGATGSAGGLLLVSVAGLPRNGGYYEVWLMNRSRDRMIAIGVLGPGGSARLPLPSAVDLSEYPVLDVSAQELDGDPAHSGTSVARGPLRG